MVKIPYFDASGNPGSAIEVDEKLFDNHVRWPLLKEAVLMYEANRRQGTHKVKTRAERAGSGKKPWRQKGTGRARCGSYQSPIWKKGGRAHGPVPRDYSYHLPRRMLQVARDSAIYGKLKDGEVVCVEKLPQEPAKTKTVHGLLRKIELAGKRVLVSVPEYDETLRRITRNIPELAVKRLADVNAYDLIRHPRWVVTREALDRLVESKLERRREPGPGAPEGSQTGSASATPDKEEKR
ncbi:MAG: 50S ribosomal protein L4 [Planctomycetes bacterium]|nr:50S ribosomal protein L4 [Planctomycetota bacterium]